MNSTDSKLVLEFSYVSKEYVSDSGIVNALQDISFELRRGESVSLTGPSGSGKTTILGLSSGLEKPSSGDIRLLDNPLNEMTEEDTALIRSLHIGFIFQSFRLIGSLNARENVEIPLKLKRDPDASKKAIVLLDQVGLSHRVTHYPSQLSGGEQQRVSIARAFAGQPTLLLADEATGNLDFESANKIQSLLFNLQKEHGTSLLIVTHDLDFASKADRKLKLKGGKIEL